MERKKNRYKNLYSIPVDDIYKWLNVLGSINSLFLEKEIKVNDSNEMKNNLKTREKELENSVLFTKDKIVKELDEHALGDRYGEDYVPSKNENDKLNVLIHSSAITNKIEHENYANANLTTAFCNMQCDESNFNNIERIDK